MNKVYLGDGVYVSFDGFTIWLTTEDGYRATNTIAIEPEVLGNFELWLHKLREEAFKA